MRRGTFAFLSCLLVSWAQAQVPIRLQGQLGGVSKAVAVSEDGTVAYLGVGPRVVLLDLSRPEGKNEIGQSEVLDGIVEDIAIEGRYAVVANGHAGLHILDISGVGAPTLVGRYESPSEPLWNRGRHVCLSGKQAFFADGDGGLRIIDLSDPAEPKCVAALGNLYAYDVAVSNGYAFIASLDKGLVVVEISTPAQPEVVAQCDVPFSAYAIEISGGYAYVTGRRRNPDDWQGLSIVDVRDPTQPVPAGGCALNDPGELAVAGKLAYVINGWNGVDIIRITNPALPARVGGYDTPGYALAVAATAEHIYIAEEFAGLEEVDVTPLAQPVSRVVYATTSIQDVAASDAYAYVASTYTGMQVVDISDPNMPQWVSWLDLNYAHCVALGNGCVYVGDHSQFTAIDVSNPLVPKVTGACDADGDVDDIAVAGAYAYAAAGEGLTIVDLSAPHRPVVVGRCDVSTWAYGVCVSGTYAYLTGTAGLDIIDISNPAAPRHMGRYSEGEWPFDVAISNGCAYLANGNSGLRVVDVSDPWLPGRIGGLSTRYARNIAIEGKYGYLTDMDEGLQVLDISKPGIPVRMGGYDRAGYGRIAVSGNYVYAADFGGGLVILKIGE